MLSACLLAACKSGSDSTIHATPQQSPSVKNSNNYFPLPTPNGFTRAEIQIPMDDGVIITAEEC